MGSFKVYIIIVIFLIITLDSFGQSDCIIGYKYIGQISSDSIIVDSVELPTTLFIVGWKEFARDELFRKHSVIDGIIDCEFASHMSCDFCGETDKIIESVFKKGGIGFYPVLLSIRGSKKSIELKIPIENIKFDSYTGEKGIKLIVNLGVIKI